MFLEVLLLLLSRVRQDALAVDSQYRLEVQGSVTVQERFALVPVTMSNGSSLTIIEGQFLNLVCVADSNPSPPASLSWLQKRKGLSSSQVSASGVLELSPVGSEDGGEFTCQVHHPLGSQCFSLHLFVQKCPSFYLCASEKQEGFCLVILPLVTVLAMGGSIVLTYVLTWAYYTSHGHEDPLDRCGDVPVFPGNCQITSTVTSRTGPCVPHPVLRFY